MKRFLTAALLISATLVASPASASSSASSGPLLRYCYDQYVSCLIAADREGEPHDDCLNGYYWCALVVVPTLHKWFGIE